MQRSAVNRISDLIAMVVYSVFLLYNLSWILAYTHEVFWLHQSLHLFDLVLFGVLTVFIGYWWGVYLWNIAHYHTIPWLLYNLGVYVPFLFHRLGEFLSRIFWLGLVNLALWMVRHLLVLASRGMSQAYPGRGMVFHIDFEDERDFKNMVRTAQEDHLPYTFRKNGKVIHPDEHDVSLSQHDLLEGTYPPIATLGVVDANPATHRDD